jgi:hypothetical protein
MFYTILKFLGGIEQYGIFSLCLFCSIFAGVLLWAFFQKQSHLDYMAGIALDPEPEDLDPAKPEPSGRRLDPQPSTFNHSHE